MRPKTIQIPKTNSTIRISVKQKRWVKYRAYLEDTTHAEIHRKALELYKNSVEKNIDPDLEEKQTRF